jgi:hypothetical protein
LDAVTDQDATATPVFPPGRYGRRRAERRHRPWLVVLVGALVLVASAGIGYRLHRQYGDPEHSARILSESERTADHVTIRFEVRSDGRNPAICIVRARAKDGLVIGSAEVPVAPGKRVVQTYTLVTRERAFVVDIPKCRPAP